MHFPNALLTLAAAALLGAGGGVAVVALAGDGGSTAATTTIEAPASPTRIADHESAAAQVYAHAKDSVAFISAEQAQGQATGSGFVVSEEGLIVTNAHVVEGATAISVKVGDGATLPATVVGRDPSTDLALLRVDDAGGQTFTPLTLADSSTLEVGDATFAIGNPYGLDRTLTTGVVSALQRHISAPNGFSIDGVIQTDAPINPGNSGGPLLDDAGRVIGVNSQILNGSGSASGGNVGIGFAVPSNTVRSVVAALEATGHVEHAYLGVQSGDAEDGRGALVGAVTPGGPAEQAGLQAGDAILAVDGRALTQGSAGLSAAVNAHAPGDRVELTVRRGGEQRQLTVTLGTQPQQAAQAQEPQQP